MNFHNLASLRATKFPFEQLVILLVGVVGGGGEPNVANITSVVISYSDTLDNWNIPVLGE